MLTLESAIEKIKQLPPEQESFFEITGIWENREVNIESIRQQAWREQD